VKTDFAEGSLAPSGVLRGDAHDLSFRTNHKAVAKDDDKYCGNCHKTSFCTDCHRGSIKPVDIHGNDYIALHSVDARRNNPNCQSCHRLETFCVGCHSRSGVSSNSKTSDFDANSTFAGDPTKNHLFHPKGWYTANASNVPTVSGAHHGFEAQRNIRECASCHSESFCIDCHGAGGEGPGSGFNPHPPNWSVNPRCGALRAKAGRMCLKCHLSLEETQCG
jgi:hypothetical protein